ncbi:MAG: hemolysin family protein [Actinobacteria bacterium]|nr:hemolysin family protein [Actinomycetota bacterium]
MINLPIFILLAAIVEILAAFFIAGRTAILKTSESRVEQLRREDIKGIEKLQKVISEKAKHVAVLQLVALALTSAGGVLLTFVFIESNIDLNSALVFAIIVVSLVGFIVLGVAPETLGKQKSDRISLITAPVTLAIKPIIWPIAKLLVAVGNALTPGKGFKEGPFATAEDLRDLVDQAEEADVIEDEERQMIHSVFELGDTVAREVMVPRTEMVWIEKGKTLRQAISLSLRSGYSRIPVIGEDSDDIVGVVYLKDISRRIFENAEAERTELVDNLMRAAYFVPDSKPADELLRDMQSARVHLAVVIDEYGGTAGLVTIEDILEEIVGEIADEYDTHAPEVNELGPNVYRVSSRIHLDDLAELINLNLSSDDEGVDTLSGYLAKQLERIPIPGTSIVIEGWEFVAERAAGRRNKIGTILIRKSESPDSE